MVQLLVPPLLGKAFDVAWSTMTTISLVAKLDGAVFTHFVTVSAHTLPLPATRAHSRSIVFNKVVFFHKMLFYKVSKVVNCLLFPNMEACTNLIKKMCADPIVSPVRPTTAYTILQ